MKNVEDRNSYSYSNGFTHVTFNKEGYIIAAQGFRRMIWWRVDEDIDEILIGKHIRELAKILKKNCAYREAYIGFKDDVIPDFEPRKRILSKLKIHRRK